MVRHILDNGQTVNDRRLEDAPMEMPSQRHLGLFEVPSKRLAAAYRARDTNVRFSEGRDNVQNLTAGE